MELTKKIQMFNKSKITIRKFIINILYYFIIFIGFIVVISFISFNFLRTRLPKEIPFVLTEIKFYFLFGICLMFIYLIKKILYPKIPNIFIIKIIQVISKPFYYFFTFIRTTKKIKPYFEKIQINLMKEIKKKTLNDNIMYIYILQIIPRIVLVLIFITDVFYVHYIQVFYYFIILTILPWIYIFIIYFIQTTLEDFIIHLERNYSFMLMLDEASDDPDQDSDWSLKEKTLYHDELVPIRQFVEIQFENYINYKNDETFIDYYGIGMSKEENELKDKLDALEYNDLKEYFQEITYKMMHIKYFLYINKEAEKSNSVVKIKVMILIGYLIGWVYILIISFHTLEEIPITICLLNILENYAKIPDPFSMLPFYED